MPNNLKNQNLQEDLSTNNLNLLSHAKKKAKKLFHLSKEKNFIIKIESLSEAQQIIAKINGYDNWHILEQVAKKETLKKENTITFHNDNQIQTNYLNKFKRKEKFILEPKDKEVIPYIIDEKNTVIYSFLQLNYLGHKRYSDIFDMLSQSQSELQFMLDREFSTIEIDLFYLEDQKIIPSTIVVDPISTKVNTLILHQEIIDLLKIDNFEEPSMSYDNYSLSIIATIKTSLLAKNEHFKLIDVLTSSLPKFSQYSFISDTKKFKKYNDIENFSHKYSLNIMEKEDINLKTIFSSTLKFLHNLNEKNMNWSWHIDSHISQITIYTQNESEQNNIAYLLNGYKKEISKNLHINSLSHIEKEAFNFKLTLSDETKANRKTKQFFSHNELVIGLPGSGKSTFSQKRILRNILNYTASHDSLPYIGVIDIGTSYDSFWNTLKNLIKERETPYIKKYTIEMNSQYCVNVFDTTLGCRFPTVQHKTFLVNFLTLLCTNPSEFNPPKATTRLISTIVDEVYKLFSDNNFPKLYDKNIELKIDQTLKKIDISVDSKTTWWEIVDILFKHEYYDEAMLAQRYAVPLLSDVRSVIEKEKVYAMYDKIITDTGENLIDFFTRMISDSLNTYPILARPTTFTIQGDKLVLINLDKVAKVGGVMAQRQTAVMYLLARYILAKEFNSFLNDKYDILEYNSLSDETYHAYYDDLLKKETEQFIYLDEVHRIWDTESIQNQITTEMTEAKKGHKYLTLLSQDFSIVKNNNTKKSFTSLYILDASSLNLNTLHKLNEFLGSEVIYLSHQNKQLKNCIYHLNYSDKGTFEHFFINKNSSQFLWSINNRIEDIKILNKIIDDIGFLKAIELLSLHYPLGHLSNQESNLDKIYNDIINKNK